MRGGQVYFVHDKVHNMDEVAERLRGLLPDVRMRAAHGQMKATELEDVMMAFLEKQIDLLITTKIIESGLDIPNTNTIIINRADHFGMAELYQLRGPRGPLEPAGVCVPHHAARLGPRAHHAAAFAGACRSSPSLARG